MKVTIRRPDDAPDGPPMAVSLRSTREILTGSWRTFRPVHVTRPSPCNLDCPAGTDVRAFLRHAADGDAESAWRTIIETNPLPAVCGRVCYHPCETACNRRALDQRVAVHAIERAIGDSAIGTRLPDSLVDTLPQATGRHVAIVGAGPAGLSCAYHLTRRGHLPVVYEAGDEPGGMLRYGIPPYRLPREILAQEVNLLRQLFVEFRLRRRLGETLTWKELAPFDATFVAVGNQRSKPAAVEGEELTGVSPAMEFLREVNGGDASPIAGRVVVVGGGNTALDAARAALRLGAAVTVLYRRSRDDMPAHPAEIAQAEREGVRFELHATPIVFVAGPFGPVERVECQRMRPGAPDASGRRAPEPVPGETFSVRCNRVFTAIGEELEQDTFADAMTVARGRLQADRWGRTTSPPLFAGGDAATGAGTVVDAIASGRRAAIAIDAWLCGGIPGVDTAGDGRVDVPDLNLFYFRAQPRVAEPMPEAIDATTGFQEVVGGVSWDAVRSEAGRCLQCGWCDLCGNCAVFCPDAAVDRDGSGYRIDYSHCKGCGICVRECPRAALALVPEEAR